MPAPFGLTPTGFNPKTAEEILTALNAFQQTNINANWDVSSGSPIGQINGIISDEFAGLWEALQAAYDSRDPDNASDQSLAQLALISGTIKKGKEKAQMLCTCNLDADTYAAGDLIASKLGDPDARVVNKNEIVSPGGDVTNIEFEAETEGPFEAIAGAISVIAEPVSGWNTVENTTPASGGTDIESDPALRVRREQEIAGAGSSRLDAIVAQVSPLTGIISLTGLENVTNITDANGLPPHSFEIVIWDGATPAADDDEIAQAILDKIPAGIDSHGQLTGTAKDSQGNTQLIKFSRVAQKPVFLDVDLTETTGYVGDAAVATALATFSDGFFAPGVDVILAVLSAEVIALAGVTDVTEIRADFSASPVPTVNLAIAVREVATIAAGDITVLST